MTKSNMCVCYLRIFYSKCFFFHLCSFLLKFYFASICFAILCVICNKYGVYFYFFENKVNRIESIGDCRLAVTYECGTFVCINVLHLFYVDTASSSLFFAKSFHQCCSFLVGRCFAIIFLCFSLYPFRPVCRC